MTSKAEPVHPEVLPDREGLRAWLARATQPRVSVLLPLQRSGPEVRQNAALLDRAAREVEQRAAEREPARGRWADRLRAVEIAPKQLVGAPAALALFGDPRELRAFALPEAVPFRVALGASFALRPLLTALQQATPYRVLAVSARRVALFEGGADGLAGTPRPGLPASLEDALGSETTEKQLRVRGTRTAGSAPAFYSHRSGKDERKLDLARFHEALARALAAELPDDGVPLVLAGTEEHQGGLRAQAKLPTLLGEGVAGNSDHLSPHELHARAWPVVQRWLATRREADGARWERARNAGKGLDLLDDIGAAAAAGRVRRLWVDAARALPGRVDPHSGRVLEGAGDDDVLDALAELVLVRGGEVVPVAAASLPSATGAAAELH
jgi:hypothetical protein